MLISQKASRVVIVLVLANIGQVTAADSKTTSPEHVNAPVSVDHPSPAVGIKIKQIRLEPPEE